MQELTEWTWNSARAAGVLPKEWPDLHGADLHGADLHWADLHGSNLTGADLTGADLHGADLTGANLTGANLTGANLTGAKLTEAKLHEADLTEADLTWANLTWAKLTEADLHGANLHGSDLTGANLTGADLTEANLDFSAWPLWCGSLDVKVDKRIAAQLAYHFCTLGCDNPEYIAARNAVLDFANQMHRSDVPRLKRITNGGTSACPAFVERDKEDNHDSRAADNNGQQRGNEEILYGIKDREYLHGDPDEAIEELLDECDTSDFAAMAPLEVREYTRVTASLDLEDVLEWVLEKLDQNFSLAASKETHPTQKMKDAALTFCTAILAEYTPYDCVPTGKVDYVNALDWVRENCPDWLEADHETQP